MSDTERISGILKRLDAASPGPWIARGNEISQPLVSKRRRIHTPPDANGMADAEFIAHAPYDMRELLQIIQRLTDRLENAQ